MESGNFYLAAAVFLPVFGSLSVPLFGKLDKKLIAPAGVILGALTFLAVAMTASKVSAGATAEIFYPLPLGFNFHLLADNLALFMGAVSSLLSLVIIYYSAGYIREYQHKAEFFTMVVLFAGSMMGLVFSANLVWLFVFWEMTAFCSWRLVGFFRAGSDTLKAGKTFLVTAFGALCLLIGIIFVRANFGTFELADLKDKVFPGLAIFFILLGIFSKSATLPFSTWLPDAGVAPTPVTSLLHAAVLVKIGVYAYARIFCATAPLDASWSFVVLFIAGLSSLVAGGAALIETNIKRIIAYSTISQIGFIFMGLASMDAVGIAGGLMYILMHGFAKAGLFLCAGIIEHKAHTKDITKMGGLFKTIPITATSFLLCSFSVMGVPPFGGFFAKFMVFQGAASFSSRIILGMFLAGAVLTFAYLLRLFYAVFLGQQHKEFEGGKEGHREMVYSVAFLGLASLVLGIFIFYPSEIVSRVCADIGLLIK